MVNISDIAAMGGRPIAVVDAIWSAGDSAADPILQGLRAASETFATPLVGGHTNLRNDRSQLSVAILGRAQRLLTSFDARAGDRLVAAIDLRGRYRDPFPNWEAATGAPPTRLRQDLEILPNIAESGFAAAAKDISQGGIVGTAMMLAECSSVGLTIDLAAIPRPDSAPLDRWLQTFPSFGYILSVRTGKRRRRDRPLRRSRHPCRRHRRRHRRSRRARHAQQRNRNHLGLLPTTPSGLHPCLNFISPYAGRTARRRPATPPPPSSAIISPPAHATPCRNSWRAAAPR